MNELNGKSVSKATGWSLLTEILLKLVSPITNMILARLLLPSAFGLVATITIVTSFAEVLTDAGFQKYIIQHEFNTEEDFEKSFSTAFYSNAVFSLVIVVLIFIFRAPVSAIVGASELKNAIFISSLSIILNAYSSIQSAAYKRFFDFKTLFNIRIVLAFVPIVTTIPLAFFLKSFWALVIGGLVGSSAQFAAFIIKPKVKLKLFYSWVLFKEMFSFSFWTLLESLTIWLTSNIDIFIVGKFLSDYYLGLYKTSMTTVNGYMSIISAAVIPVLFSTLSRYQNDDNKFKETFFKFQKLISILLIPMGFGLYLFRDLATSILLGSNWSEASDFIGMYSIAISFQIVICYFASEVFRSKGQPKVSMFYQWLYIFVLVPVIYISSKAGFEALTISRALSSLAFIIFALVFLHVIYKINVLTIVKNILPQIFSAVVMFATGLLLKVMLDGIIWNIVVIMICVVIYFSVLLLFKSSRNAIFETDLYKEIIDKFK